MNIKGLVLCMVICGHVLHTNITDLSIDVENPQEALYHNYLLASYYQRSGTQDGIQAALELYQEITQTPHPVSLYTSYFPLLFQTGQFQQLTVLYKKQKPAILTLLKNNTELTLITAQALLLAGNQDAEALFASLAKVHHENPQVTFYTAQALINHNKLDQAAKYLAAKLKNPALRPHYYLFHFLMAKIHLLQQNFSLAHEAINQSLKASPLFDKALLFKAMLLEQAGNVSGAIKAYTNFLDSGKQDSAIEKHLISLLFAEQHFEQAASYLRKMTKTTHEDYCNLALVELRAGNAQNALTNIETALQKKPNFERAKLLFVETILVLHAQKPSEALSNKLLTFMKQWINNNPSDVNTINILLTLKNTTIKIEPVAETLKQLSEEHNNSIALKIAYSDICLDMKHYETCVTTYKDLLQTLTDPVPQSTIFAQLGYAYFMLQRYTDAEEILKTALTKPVIHPASYNTLAYLYAIQNRNYDQALELVEKALKEQPVCAAYLDTKGYILSKLGKKKEALFVFQEALSHAPADETILMRKEDPVCR